MKKLKIMIIEDSPATLSRYKGELDGFYEVDYFPDARSALHRYSGAGYDLVVTDVMLPFKSGESLIFDMKYINPYQKIVVISGALETLNLKQDHGVLVFQKPMSIKAVVDHVLLGRRLLLEAPKPTLSRRRYPRFPVNLKANVLANSSKDFIGYITDLSLGGARLKVPDREIELGKLIMEIPIGETIISTEGICRWSKVQSLTPILVDIGIEFNKLRHNEYSALDIYLESLSQVYE